MNEPKEITDFRQKLDMAMRAQFNDDGTPSFTGEEIKCHCSMPRWKIEYYLRCKVTPEGLADVYSW